MKLSQFNLENKVVGIVGHVHPDGDCVGSTFGLYNYIVENIENVEIDIYLEDFNDSFKFLKSSSDVKTKDKDKIYDLLFVLDCGDEYRVGVLDESYKKAKKRVLIDHHITNSGFCDENIIDVKASSTSEIIYQMFDEDKISKDVAQCLYLGIVHDTGLFQYSNTTPKTMRIISNLLGKDIDFTSIIEKTFFEKTYIQNKILGYALYNSYLYLEDKLIISVLSKEEMKSVGARKKDIDAIVANLRNTKGVEVATFIYEVIEEGKTRYKVSLRSKTYFDVSKIALKFSGGGHKKAAGFIMDAKNLEEAKNIIIECVKKQLL